jgi:hypothetical protein
MRSEPSVEFTALHPPVVPDVARLRARMAEIGHTCGAPARLGFRVDDLPHAASPRSAA